MFPGVRDKFQVNYKDNRMVSLILFLFQLLNFTTFNWKFLT